MDEEGEFTEGPKGESSEQEPWSQGTSQQGQQQPPEPPQSQGQQQPPRQHPPQPSHQPSSHRPSAFSSERLNETLGMALVIGVILMFVGGILVSSAGFIEVENNDDWNLKRNLNAVATLLSSLGLLAIGGAAAWAYYQTSQLTEKQRLLLVLLVIGSILSFAIILTTGPMGIGGIW
ncbi:MAG: hypothetical protein ACLFSM_08865 [Thermoplasmata archaeon]